MGDPKARAIHPLTGGNWVVVFQMLGLNDYYGIVRPWCVDNLAHEIYFVASSMIHCESEDDAMLLYLRFK